MSGSRILIIADESETEFALQSDLKQMGHEVTGVISADEAIDDSTAHEPDLVIMDIPSGKEKKKNINETIHAVGSRFRVPVVCLLNDFEKHGQIRAFHDGIWHLTKPYKVSDLETILVAIQQMTELRAKLSERENYLRTGKSRYRVLFENAPIGIMSINRDGTVIEANPKFLELVGMSSTEPLKEIDWLTYPPFVEAGISDSLLRCMESAVTTATEFPFEVSGTLSFLKMILTPLWDSKGEVYGCQAVIENVTDRKLIEEEIRKTNRAFKTLSECNEALVRATDESDLLEKICRIIVDVGGHRFVWVGYAMDDPGKSVQPVAQAGYENGYLDTANITWEDTERGQGPTGKAIRTGKPQLVRNVTTDYHYGPWRKAALERGYASGLALPLMSEGKAFGALNVYSSEPDAFGDKEIKLLEKLADNLAYGIISLRTSKMRERSSQAQMRLAKAVEQAAEVIVITDVHGKIVYVNPAFEKSTGYSREAVLGIQWDSFQKGDYDEKLYQEIRDTVSKGEVWTGRFISKKIDGTIYQEDATISPVRDSAGKIINYVAVKRDVTKELELQKQLRQAQKMEAIGTLAGGVAHDFNNILTIVQGYAELLLIERGESDTAFRDLKKIRDAARRGADLVKNLLAFSRKAESNPVPLNLNTEVKQVEKLLLRTIPKMIDIQVSTAEDLWTVKADPGQMQQILLNIAVNAKDAMPDGGRLHISTRNVTLDEEFSSSHLGTKSGDYVMIEISDTGHGIDKDIIDHIFEPFFTTKERGKGTGLGLSMVYGIVKQHGGYISCESTKGEGTVFRIYFPAINEVPTQKSDVQITAPKGGPGTILLVDDEDLVRELGIEFLGRAGYKVIGASNGKQALNIYIDKKEQIDLIILDLIMPEMGGKQCLEKILKINPNAKVLISSGYSTSSSVQETLASGAVGFISKPFKLHQMLNTIRDVLR